MEPMRLYYVDGSASLAENLLKKWMKKWYV